MYRYIFIHTTVRTYINAHFFHAYIKPLPYTCLHTHLCTHIHTYINLYTSRLTLRSLLQHWPPTRRPARPPMTRTG